MSLAVDPTRIARRRPWLAGILGLIVPPAAFLYVGRIGVAFVVYAAFLAALGLMGWSGAIHASAGWFAVLALLAVVLVFQVVYPVIQARRRRNDYELRWYNRGLHYFWITVTMLVGINLVLANRGSLLGYESFRQTSPSMAPALSTGDYVLVDTRPATIARIGRGDVVVFDHPMGGAFAKRLVGLPGDRVESAGDEVRINGVELIDPLATGERGGADVGGYGATVPSDRMFLLGDNRTRSQDSRHDGPYERASLKGKITRIWYSPEPSRIGPVR